MQNSDRALLLREENVRLSAETYTLLSKVLSVVCAVLLGIVGWMASIAWEQLTQLQGRVATLEREQAVSLQVHESFAVGLGRLEVKLDRVLEQQQASRR